MHSFNTLAAAGLASLTLIGSVAAGSDSFTVTLDPQTFPTSTATGSYAFGGCFDKDDCPSLIPPTSTAAPTVTLTLPATAITPTHGPIHCMDGTCIGVGQGTPQTTPATSSTFIEPTTCVLGDCNPITPSSFATPTTCVLGDCESITPTTFVTPTTCVLGECIPITPVATSSSPPAAEKMISIPGMSINPFDISPGFGPGPGLPTEPSCFGQYTHTKTETPTAFGQYTSTKSKTYTIPTHNPYTGLGSPTDTWPVPTKLAARDCVSTVMAGQGWFTTNVPCSNPTPCVPGGQDSQCKPKMDKRLIEPTTMVTKVKKEAGAEMCREQLMLGPNNTTVTTTLCVVPAPVVMTRLV